MTNDADAPVSIIEGTSLSPIRNSDTIRLEPVPIQAIVFMGSSTPVFRSTPSNLNIYMGNAG